MKKGYSQNSRILNVGLPFFSGIVGNQSKRARGTELERDIVQIALSTSERCPQDQLQ